MSRYHPNRTMSKREADKISALFAKTVAPKRIPGCGLTASENQFRESAVGKGASVWRNGWPDFLVEMADKTIIGVEVKSSGDTLSKAQRQMFNALEKIGLKVFVWEPRAPKQLTHWRNYWRGKLERADPRKAVGRSRAIDIAESGKLDQLESVFRMTGTIPDGTT